MSERTQRESMVALHGEMIVRMAERMMTFRYARTKALKDVGFDETKLPDTLDRYAECKALAAIVQAAKLAELPMEYDGTREIGDHGAYFRLYELKAGHVLTEKDVMDIECVLAEYNDEIGNETDKWHAAREQALRDIGGQELVDAVAAEDTVKSSQMVAKAMQHFRDVSEARKRESH